jgi:hypothetical protein
LNEIAKGDKSMAINKLPEFCYGVLPTTDEVILIKRGEKGYYPYLDGAVKGKDVAKELNNRIGVTPAQAEAMMVGSMFGWDVPGADPDMYDEEGMLKKSVKV